MNEPRRRAADTLQVVEGLLESQLGQTVEGRPLARLAAAAAIDYSGASWGALLLDEGTGLEAVLTLRDDLEEPAKQEAVVDSELVRRAAGSGQVESKSERLAAPILLEGRLRGALYLDGIDEAAMPEADELAGTVAKRIASFLHSADLVDRVARQQRGLEELESLGTTLGGPELRRRDFANAAESARRGTGSDIGVLALLDARGAVAVQNVSGEEISEIGPLVESVAQALARTGALPQEATLGTHQLLEPFWADELTDPDRQAEPKAAGFVAVGRRDENAYEPNDHTFLRALAHLIGGAVGRERYFRRAAEDPVTETGSRLALQLGLAEARGRSLATGRPFSVLLADIDDFKPVNDAYGHLVGDEVLRQVAEALRARLRTHDFVARFGGDEFVLVLPETTASEAAKLAEELRVLVAETTFSRHGIRLSLSIGVAVFSPDIADDSELLRRADRALYDSKSAGRNRVSVFSSKPAMRAYLDLLDHILTGGSERPDRTGTGTLAVFGHQMRFDLGDGFPLLTTKKLHLRSILHELLWFLKGETNIEYLTRNKVSIWNEWADADGDLGPIYGYQWRSWPAPDGQTIDQISQVVEQIRSDPFSRRHIVSAWNVADLERMALPPCHTMFQFHVAAGKLSCQLYQRSGDVFLGVPFNIASYALLTLMMAQTCELDPGDFVLTLGDAHLYSNHIEQAQLQLTREPGPPTMRLDSEIRSIFDFRFRHFTLEGYKPQPHIKAPIAV